jgi:AcrR family transcriptional regulator
VNLPLPTPEAGLRSGRHGLSREAVVISQRERMTTAVLEAVADKGYTAVTVADVLSRAHVSRATFYEHFADKQECFLTAHAEALADTLAAVAAPVANETSWIDQIHAGLRALLAYLAEHDAIARAGMIHVIGGGAEADRAYRDAIDAFAPFLDAGRAESPEAAEVPPLVTRAVVGAIAGAIREEALAGRVGSLPDLLPDLVYVTFVPYLGHERAQAERERAQTSLPPAD